MKQAITTILCDLGSVLVDVDFDKLCQGIASVSPKSVSEVMDFLPQSGLEARYETGRISSLYFFTELQKKLSLDCSYAEFKEIWNRIFTQKPEMVDLMGRLRKYYRVVLVSNTNALHYPFVEERFPAIHKLFHSHVLSYKVGLRKPARDFYRLALKKGGAAPEEAFYIDDREDLTEAASKMGIRSHTFKYYPPLIKDLRQVGIKGA